MKIIVNTVVLLIGLYVLSGCRKQITGENEVTKKTTSSSRISAIAGYENEKNPYDHFGIRHNEILTALEQHIQESHDTTRAAKREFIVGYCLEQGIDIRKSLAVTEKMMAEAAADDYKDIYSHPSNGKYMTLYTGKVLSLINQVDSEDTFREYVEQVKELESEVLNTQGISEEEKVGILGSMSIARHSAGFWFARKENFQETEQTNKRIPGWLNWIVRMKAAITVDHAAFIVGIITFSDTPGDDAASLSSFVHDGIRDYW